MECRKIDEITVIDTGSVSYVEVSNLLFAMLIRLLILADQDNQRCKTVLMDSAREQAFDIFEGER